MRNWEKERIAIWDKYLRKEIEWKECIKQLDKLEDERQCYHK